MRRIIGFYKRHKLATVLGALLALGTGAVAAWIITTPDVKGFAKGAALTPVVGGTLTTSEVPGDLMPGGTGDLSFKVTNPNTVPLKLVNVALGSWSSDKINCVGSSVITATGNTGEQAAAANLIVGAGQTATLVVPDAVALSATAPTECQGALFTNQGGTLTFST